jgi:effector-binding domain-containing protein
MAHQVSFETVAARPFIGVASVAARSEIGQVIRSGLDKVWALIRATPEIGPPGSSVVLYAPAPGDRLAMWPGVYIDSAYPGSGEVQRHETPAGVVAHVVHLGPYDRMMEAHRAAQQAGLAKGGLTGLSWEVYGDHDPDPAKLRTDIYYQIGPAAAAARA